MPRHVLYYLCSGDLAKLNINILVLFKFLITNVKSKQTCNKTIKMTNTIAVGSQQRKALSVLNWRTLWVIVCIKQEQRLSIAHTHIITKRDCKGR